MKNFLTINNLVFLVPFIAPLIVSGIRQLFPLVTAGNNKKWLPYVCVMLAVGLTYLMDWFFKVNNNPFLIGLVSGTMGIGIRELTANALKALNMKSVEDSGSEPGKP